MEAGTLQTTTERLDRNRAKLRVEVPEAALAPALNAAYRRWSNEIKVHGFRKGKVPRQLIDARVGADSVREEALRDALPDLYVEALRAEDLQAIAPPEISVVSFEAGSPIVFEATVDLRPEITLPDFSEVVVDAPEAEVTESDLDEQIERLRERYAELETVRREARRGDHVLIDLRGSRNGLPVEGASSPDLLYEIGSGSGPPRLDAELEGNRPGAILRFSDTLPAGSGELAGQEISFTVLLKEVKARRLPPIDDDFAKTVGEYDTLDELRSELRSRVRAYKRQLVAEQVRQMTLEKLVEAADFEAPAVLVEEEFEHRLSHVRSDLGEAGLTLEQYAAQMDQTELEFRGALRRQVVISIKAELLLEEIARKEDFQVTDEEVGREIAYIAARTDSDPNEVAKQLAESGSLRTVLANILRREALDHVVRHATIRGFDVGQLDDQPEVPPAQPEGPAQEADNVVEGASEGPAE